MPMATCWVASEKMSALETRFQSSKDSLQPPDIVSPDSTCMLLIHTETKVSAIPQTDPGPDELDKAQRHYVIPCYLSSLKIELVAKSLVNLGQIIFLAVMDLDDLGQ